MRAYLSSHHLPHLKALAALTGREHPEGLRLSLIPNAHDCYPSALRRRSLEGFLALFESHGIDVDVLDLADDDPRAKLNDREVVWLGGENTFYLSWIVQKIGFAAQLKERLQDGLVYAGDSAGAILAC